jgi:Pyruvate/2-oxoacid:ferredoxin oxidoreductase delta subunit
MENRFVWVSVHAQTGKILEILSKESKVRHIIPKARKKLKPFGFTAILDGESIPPPIFESEGRSTQERASLLFKARSQGIEHEIGMDLCAGSPTIGVRYTCKNLTPTRVKGDFYFYVPGYMGEAPEDDVMIIPGKQGFKKFESMKAFGQCPTFLHPFHGWYAVLDAPSRDLFIVSLKDVPQPGEEVVISQFTPTQYNFGLAREDLYLDPGETYPLDFSLTPLSTASHFVEKEKTWWPGVRDLYRNLDLLLKLPSGPQRKLIAPWGVAHAILDPTLVQRPSDVSLHILAQLNPATRVSPDLDVEALLRRYGTEEIVWQERKALRLGGIWRPREKTISFSLPASVLEQGRYGVEWRVREGERLFHDRLNLGVAGERIALPPPDVKTHRPLERVMARRMSQRIFKQEAIDLTRLGYVLYHAAGLLENENGWLRDTMIRPGFQHPGRYEVFIHFVHEGAIYRYDRENHCLVFYQMGKPFYISDLEEEDTLAYARTRMVQAPVLVMVADGGGASEAIFQTFHLAAAAVDLGYSVFGDKEIGSLKLPPGYRQLYYGRLGIPAVPFLFEPEEESLGRENMPRVDGRWSPYGKRLAEKGKVPREPEMPDVSPNLRPVREHELSLEEALRKAGQVNRFQPNRPLDVLKKSQLLWAAYGRSYLREKQDLRAGADHRRPLYVPQGVHRTVPSACGEYLVDLYLADESGVYQYFGKRHYLHLLRRGDYREALVALTGAPFENPSALFLFARRDRMLHTPEGEGYEEAFFSAQNMSLVAAAMELGIGFARVTPPPQGAEGTRQEWKRILSKTEALGRVPHVGGKDNIAPDPAIPFAIAAAGRASEDDLRWWKPTEHPLTFAAPETPEKDLAIETTPLRPFLTAVKEIFPEAGEFTPSKPKALYYIASGRSRQKDGTFKKEVRGFAADTAQVAPEVVGYHGPIHLVLGLNPYGSIKDLKLIDHVESKEHMDRILASDFLEGFKGKNPGEMAGVDIVSGATVTCVALAQAVQTAQNRLCGYTGEATEAAIGEDPAVLLKASVLACLFTATFCLLRAPRGWRLFLLAMVVCILGCIWNWSFTYADLLNPTGLFSVLTVLLITLAVASTLLKGRIYCGWICPFGAVQDLVGEGADKLKIKKRGAPPLPRVWQSLKYAILLVLLLLGLITGARGYLNPEPFSDFFAWNTSSWRLYLGCAVLVLSVAISRPFCRYLCPSGALLACLHRLKGNREKKTDFDFCQGCGRCSRACPTSAIEWDPKENRVLGRNRFECIGCEECIKATQHGPCSIQRGTMSHSLRQNTES